MYANPQVGPPTGAAYWPLAVEYLWLLLDGGVAGLTETLDRTGKPYRNHPRGTLPTVGLHLTGCSASMGYSRCRFPRLSRRADADPDRAGDFGSPAGQVYLPSPASLRHARRRASRNRTNLVLAGADPGRADRGFGGHDTSRAIAAGRLRALEFDPRLGSGQTAADRNGGRGRGGLPVGAARQSALPAHRAAVSMSRASHDLASAVAPCRNLRGDAGAAHR